MLLKLFRGTTSKVVPIMATNSATGLPLTGLSSTTPGLVAYYKIDGGTVAVAITLVAGTVGTWSSGGFVEVDSVKLPGLYELGVPNLEDASGTWSVVYLSGVSSLSASPALIELDAINYQSTSLGLSLAKTTNLTGFNDIAATAIVSSGAINTASGAVSTVTTTTNVTNAVSVASGSISVIQSGLATSTALASLATTVGTPAQASQIPANFTTATFISAGVFSTGSLVNAPTGGGGGGGGGVVTGYATGQDPATLVWAGGTRSLTDKAGFLLGPTGLDSISVADPGAPANMTTLPKMIVGAWRALFKKSTQTATQWKRYANDDATVNATATLSDDGTTQTIGDFA